MDVTEEDERLFTVEEYAALREPDSVRSELVRGRIVREPPPSAPHGFTQARLGRYLDAFVEEEGLGFVLTETGVVTDADASRPTVRGPDVLFVSRERLPGALPDGYLTVAPDLVVEVVSPSNTASDIQDRVLEYLDEGVRLVWVVDPMARTATTYRSRSRIAILDEDGELDGEEVLPGFRLPLTKVLP